MIETVITQIGWGWYQIRNTIFSFIVVAVLATHILSPIFIAYPMNFTCNTAAKKQVEMSCNTTFQLNQSVLFVPSTLESNGHDHCREYINPDLVNGENISCDEANLTLYRLNQTRLCSEFVFTSDGTVESSIVAEYQMVCSKSSYNYLLQSLFMVGVFFNGLIFGKQSDRFGRRKVFLLMNIGTLIFSFAITFAKSFPVYAALRTIVGFVCFIAPTHFVLVSESTKTNKRAWALQIGGFGYSIGTLLLVLLAYCIKSWQMLQLTTCILSITFSIIWWFTDESPRWLASKGRNDEAVKILEKISKINKVEMPETLLTYKDNVVNNANIRAGISKSLNRGIISILKCPQLRKMTLVLNYSWFASSCAFYGLTLNVASVGGNIYTTSLVMALMAIPAYPLAIYLCQKIGRRFVISTSFVLAGLFCASMYFIPSELKFLQITVFLFGRVFALIPFNTLYLYTIEINPTVIRSTAVNFGSSCARIGAIVAPAIAMTELIHPTLPYITFGFVTVLAGVLVLLLPETKNAPMCETIEETSKFLSENPGLLERILCGRKQGGQ